MRHILVYLLLATATFASAQQIDFSGNKVTPDLLFTRFSSKDGLPDNRIRSIFQDSKGYLWVGTMNGIGKYDGYHFKKYYNQNNPSSISGNWAFAICEDTVHNIWIGTLNGLNVFDTRKERFKTYKNIPSDKNSLVSNKITALHFDKSGKLWIGTQDGLARLDPSTGKFDRFEDRPFKTYISKIIGSSGDKIWIATALGVVHYNTKTNTSQFYEIKVKADPYGNYFWSLLEDKGTLYIATATQGLIRLSYNQENAYQQFNDLNTFSNTKQDLLHTEVFDLCKSSGGDLWLATDQGLAKIEQPATPAAQLHYYRNNPLNNQSLSHNTVYQLFIDRTDNLWCGTEMGLNKLNLEVLPFQYFTFQDPRSEDQVRSLYTRDGNNIWVGTAKNAFYKYNLQQDNTETFRLKPVSSAINSHRSLYVGTNDDVWVGTLGGAFQMNSGNLKTSIKKVDGRAVFAFLKDSKNNLWLGTNDGLLEIKSDGTRKSYVHNPNDPTSLSSSFVRSLYEDHNGKIWVGFETSGVSYFDPANENFFRVTSNAMGEKVSGNIIYSILEFPKNVIWVGSESGLNKIMLKNDTDGKYNFRIKNYFEKDGLSDKSVNGILPEKGNFLWISSIKGLLRFDILKEKFEQYLPTLNFSYSCAYKFNDHQLMFGASDGFLMFDPQKIKQNQVLPEVVISDLKLFNKEIEIDSAFNGDVILTQALQETKEISLGYKNNVFTLAFIGLHFSDPSNNSYAYQMEGFDKDWIFTSATEREVTYTNLDPGTYYFKVKAANSFGKWNNKPAILKIKIFPPPWKTWWAILAYIVLFISLLIWLVKYLVKQSRQRHEFETERLLRLKDEALHQEQLGFFTNITHELQTPLTLINGSVERFMYKSNGTDPSSDRNYFLSMIHQQSSRLTYLVNQLLDFRKAEAGHLKNQYSNLHISALLTGIADLFVPLCDQKQLEFSAKIAPDITGWTDKDKLEKIIFNLLSNAFKHSENEQKIIFSAKMDRQTGMLEITVSNSGCTLSSEQLSQIFDKFFVVNNKSVDKYSHGIGLAFTRQLVTLLDGQIEVLNENEWISFKVSLPVSAEGLKEEEQKGPHAHTPSYLLRSITADPGHFLQRSAIESNKHALVAALEAKDKSTILIVEDEAAIRYLLRDILTGHYIVYEAENGKQALEFLQNFLPDLIVSDIMMPEIDGLELCNRVKNTPNTCHLPFVLLSARGTMEQKTDGYDAGADAYIPKPFDTAHLLIRIRRLLEYRQRLHDMFKKDGLIAPLEEKNLIDGDKQFLDKLVKIIEDNIDNTELDSTFLEPLLAMSKMQLYRKLKSLSNMTPGEFIRHIRLQKTVQLLQNTQLTVSEIFYRSGFNNQSYFFREFKKRFHCSPNEYRAQQRIHI